MPFGAIGKAIGNIGGAITKPFSSGLTDIMGSLGGMTSQITNMVSGLKGQLGGLQGIAGPALGGLGAYGMGGWPGLAMYGASLLGQGGSGGDDSDGFNALGTGHEMGLMQRAMMDQAYPGTNPWERLGTGQAGAQGHTEALGRNHQKRLQEQELASRDRVAQKAALAAVAPSAIQQHPEMAGPIMSQLGANVSAGPNLSKAMSERRFAWEQRVKSVEMALRNKEVDISEFNSNTQRWMTEIAEDRLNMDEAYKEAEILLGDKNAAIAHVQALSQAFSSMEGDVWRSMMSRLGGIDSREGIEQWFQDLQSQSEAVKEAIADVPARGITMKKRR